MSFKLPVLCFALHRRPASGLTIRVMANTNSEIRNLKRRHG